ncbi:C40 family peptidase [Nocardioides solisilvae]|uniref:C40 family peptidase n=1 Tax=Nocardioides solisilvae TaxID=1542435 RepID=UPI000D746540|nr:C40 family peptidase [Nocardioides solisilvae]
MPATTRTLGARPDSRRTPSSTRSKLGAHVGGTLVVGLVAGLGITAPAAAPASAAPVRQVDVTQSPGSPATTADQPDRTAKDRRLARKARKAKRAKVRARKAKWAEIRRIGRAKNVALAQRGDSYGYGATGPSSFDCSGLVQFAYHRAGLKGMPRSSSAQAGHTRRIPKSAMRPGDLMFFANGGGVYHVGIFTGRGKGGVPLMVHSSRPGTPVQVAAPWTSSWFAGTVR